MRELNIGTHPNYNTCKKVKHELFNQLIHSALFSLPFLHPETSSPQKGSRGKEISTSCSAMPKYRKNSVTKGAHFYHQNCNLDQTIFFS